MLTEKDESFYTGLGFLEFSDKNVSLIWLVAQSASADGIRTTSTACAQVLRCIMSLGYSHRRFGREASMLLFCLAVNDPLLEGVYNSRSLGNSRTKPGEAGVREFHCDPQGTIDYEWWRGISTIISLEYIENASTDSQRTPLLTTCLRPGINYLSGAPDSAQDYLANACSKLDDNGTKQQV